ncbi:MAG TPA: hypothetical protein VFE65_04635 [Pseudonocardia sp.]|jgi:acyl dehydratase|nr:hypothetical protein [Pseudonocardia sp.]
MPRIAQEFPDITFAQLEPGSVFRSTLTLAAELVGTYDRLVGAPPGERTVVPTWVYCTFRPVYQAMGGRMEQGSIHARQQIEHVADARVGDVLDVQVTVTTAEVLKGRQTVVLSTEFTRDGAVLCRVRSTILWGYTTE